MNLSELLITFPEMSKESLRMFRKSVDGAYRNFSREYGDAIEAVFDPVLYFLVWFEKLLQSSPWPIVILVILILVYLGSRSIYLTIGSLFALLLIGYFGMWEDTMSTVSIIGVCTFMSIGLGIPIGIAMSNSDRARAAITPILDVMQTMPSFVYLIPVVMLLGIGKIPGLLAVIIYAIPPIIRLTDLGIREVDKEVLEAADAFGANKRQKLFRVQLPLALPTIFAGINQTIMMALAMVVIASMIGVKGLGQPVLKAITNQYFTMGLLNGLAIVALAIIFDRVSQSFGKRLQQHRSGSRD
ncbi:proline/glycine betaine ABC transporter permease [Pelagibacteraceae bacterium]|nr:proline/glycine betaine ABC transporter permease [Pelagibacteraceae bacterium]|tara:strand:+ start:562 stop:1458 length:897 start_codon:yes stop_codon:yes gene_type:complete